MAKEHFQKIKETWWVISDKDFIEAMLRAHAGEDPYMLILEYYANSEVETYGE